MTTTFDFQTATPADLELMLSKPIPADLDIEGLDAHPSGEFDAHPSGKFDAHPSGKFAFDAIEFPFGEVSTEDVYQPKVTETSAGCSTVAAVEEYMRDELTAFVLQQLEADKLDAQVVAKRVLRRRKRLREQELCELDKLEAVNKKLRALCDMHKLHWAGLEVLQHGCMIHAARKPSPQHRV